MKTKQLPSKEQLNKMLRYEKETGFLYRRDNGKRAGGVSNEGYLTIGVLGGKYSAHRIVWTMMNGRIPTGYCMDHIDHNKLNNKVNNLRIVTNQENCKNRKLQTNNKSGVVGVHWDKRLCQWKSMIEVFDKKIYLGIYKNIEDAILARSSAEVKYNFHKNHGKT